MDRRAIKRGTKDGKHLIVDHFITLHYISRQAEALRVQEPFFMPMDFPAAPLGITMPPPVLILMGSASGL